MQTKEFVEFLVEEHMPVFTITDAVKILRNSRAYARLFLHRCVKNRIVGRVERGIYYVIKRHNEYEIASHILDPSYVSMVSALAYYGLTTQIPRIVYVASTKRHKPIKNIEGFDIVFRRIKAEMMFGYQKRSDGNIFIAEPEKAIVDIYYFNDVNDLDPMALERPPRIDIDRLVLYAKRSRKKSVIDGVAAMLREHGYRTQAKMLIMAKPYFGRKHDRK